MDFGGFAAIPPGMPMGVVPKITRGVMRRNVDYTSSVIAHLQNRIWQRGKRDKPIIQPDVAYVSKMVPPVGSEEDPVTAITTKFVKTVYNKQRCPIFCTSWAPDGRRLIAGAASGEFSLWNGINLNFEALMKSHDSSVRSMQWSHNTLWMATTDDRGVVKYWQSNMNNVHTFQAHNEPIRGCSFSPTDAKLATCSDDGTVRVFDFLRSSEEFILRGHGADVKCVDWHPRKNLLVSGSKDNQQPIKLWDPKAGQSISTIHAHKAAVTCVKWNRNGTWLLTASRDHLIKLYDIRTMKELEVLKGHKSDVNTVSWHPVHEKLFTSGGSDGAILFWLVGNKRDIGGMESPHDSFVWSLAWHPLGHMLCSGSNDHTCKFWCRNRPGDEMKDRHSSGGLPVEEMADNDVYDSLSMPGGTSLTSSNIALPPPSKNPSTSLPPASKTWNVGQTKSSSDKPPAPSMDFQLPVLGADIIKEQFGKSGGVSGPATPNLDPHSSEPVKSGLFMHQQQDEMKEGDMKQGFGSQHSLNHPPSNQSPTNFPHQVPPPGSFGMGEPRMRGPQNFQGPRPPMHMNRRDWSEGGGDFPVRPPHHPHSPHEFHHHPHRHYGMRPVSHLNDTSNPFSWQRQEHRERLSYEDMHHYNDHNPYVYRREDNKLRDPREQRMLHPPHPGMRGEENSRRPSQDEHTPDWQNKGPPAWAQEHHGGPPPIQERFDQRRDDFGPPRDQHRNMGEPGGHFTSGPHGGPPQDRQGIEQPFHDRDNWHPQFGRERPPHERPQHNFGPPPQEQRFPPQSNFPPDPEQRNEASKGPPMNNAPGKIPPQLGEQRGHVHDPRSQRAQVPTSQPQKPQGFPPGRPGGPPNQPPNASHPLQQNSQFSREGPPQIHDGPTQFRGTPPQNLEGPPQHRPEGPPRGDGAPQHREGPPHPTGPPHRPQPVNDGPPPSQVRDAPPQPRDGPPPHMQPQPRDAPPPHIRDVLPTQPHGVPPPHEGPPRLPPHHDHPPQNPQFRDGPPPPHDGPQQRPPHIREGPPPPHDGPQQRPPHIRDGPPPPHDGPQQRPPHIRDGPPPHDGPQQRPPHIREGPPPPHDGPQQRPPHIRDGPPPPHDGPQQRPPHIRDGPPPPHDGPQQRPPHIRDGPPLHDGPQQRPPPHIRDGPPPHDGPPQHPPHIREGPPPLHDGPPLMPPQSRDGHPQAHDGPPQHPPHVRDGPPQPHDGPPQHSPHIHDGPPHILANTPPQHVPQRFEEFHGKQHGGPPAGQQFFPNQPGNPPHHVENPATSQPHQYLSRPPPPQNFNPENTRGGPPPGSRFPAPHPSHIPREQEPFHSPHHFQEQQGPPPNMQGPPSQQFSGLQRDQLHLFDHFSEQHRPPLRGPPPSGPSDPRRQHPPHNFPGAHQNSPGAGDRFPHHPHHPSQPDINWDHQPPQHHNAFPGENRFEANHDPHERRTSRDRGDGRDGRDKRDRDRDRERDRGHRDRSPKHHRDGQPGAKRSRSERDSSKHSRREKRK